MSYPRTAHTILLGSLASSDVKTEGKENKEPNIQTVHTKVLRQESNVIHSRKKKTNREWLGYRHSRHRVLRQAIRKTRHTKIWPKNYRKLLSFYHQHRMLPSNVMLKEKNKIRWHKNGEDIESWPESVRTDPCGRNTNSEGTTGSEVDRAAAVGMAGGSWVHKESKRSRLFRSWRLNRYGC